VSFSSFSGPWEVCQRSKARNPPIQYFQISDSCKQSKSCVCRNRCRRLTELLTFVALPPAITSECPTIRRRLTSGLPYDRITPVITSNIPPLRTAVSCPRFCARRCVVVVMRKLNNSKGMIVDKRGSRALTEFGTPEIGDSQPSVFQCTSSPTLKSELNNREILNANVEPK
jgi:hypothetical protein